MSRSEDLKNQSPVLVVGGGLSGLACASRLTEMGVPSIVLDRGRRVGGRLSTKQVECDNQSVLIDHGAPKIEVNTDEFRGVAEHWVRSGVARWSGATMLCGVPCMRSIAEALTERIDVRTSSEVLRIERAGADWRVDAQGYNEPQPFRIDARAIVFACPPVQADRILSRSGKDCPEQLREARFKPAWVYLMCVEATQASTAAHEIEHDVLQSIRVQGCGDGVMSVVSTVRDELAREHADARGSDVEAILRDATVGVLEKELGLQIDNDLIQHEQAHRWGFARATSRISSECIWDPDSHIGYAGDAFCGAGADWGEGEGAFLSGERLAEQIAASISA